MKCNRYIYVITLDEEITNEILIYNNDCYWKPNELQVLSLNYYYYYLDMWEVILILIY